MRRIGILGAVLLAAIGLVGCSVAPTKSSPASSSGPTAELSTSEDAVAFGTVSDGSAKTNSLAVTNTSSTANLTLTQAVVTGTGFTLSTAPTLPAVIAPGQSITLIISFSPKAGGAASGNLALASDAADATVNVALTGSGLSPGELAVSPASLAFGSVAVGSPQSQTATLTAGGSAITITTIDQTGQGYSLSGLSFPLTLAAGQSVSFSVGFDPQTAGTFSGKVSFVSNASDTPSLALSGTATQSSSYSVTLSWDASASMVIGYNLYRGIHSGGPYTKLTETPQAATSYVDSTVAAATTYFYVATSVDSSDVESAYSNQTVVTIP